ncbi:MAG: SRPBCC family protein [Solirubrobacteraceae bacterium]
MKQLTATASGVAATPIDRCYERLLDVERYPQWYPDGAKRVEVLERDGEGVPVAVDAVLAAAAGPLRKAFPVRLVVQRERPVRVALARMADDRGDHEVLTIAWSLRSLGAAETAITVELAAALNVPPFLPVDPIAREVANGFLQAALRSV